MKIKNPVILLCFVLTTSLSACKKYKKYDNLEVIESSYSGVSTLELSSNNPEVDFQGVDDSGEYSFAWTNSKERASASIETSSGTGEVKLTVRDSRGKKVLEQTIQAGSNSITQVSEKGKSGTWKVSLDFSNYSGDGNLSISGSD